MSTGANYPVPLYLNQRHVFDTLAMIDDGFSMQTDERQIQNAETNRSSSVGGELGLKNIFAFLPLGINAGKSSKQSSSSASERSIQRVHTPNSLFFKLRQTLGEEGLIKSTVPHAVASTYVEARLALHKNPVLEILESFQHMMGLASAAEIVSQGGRQTKNAPGKVSTKAVQGMLAQLLKQFEEGKSIDLIGKTSDGTDVNVIVTLERQFLNDPSMADLLDGEVVVLGKVVRSIEKGAVDKINLMRHTTLGKMSTQVVAQMFSSVDDLKGQGFNLPSPNIEISGPALQILPTAIYI